MLSGANATKAATIKITWMSAEVAFIIPDVRAYDEVLDISFSIDTAPDSRALVRCSSRLGTVSARSALPSSRPASRLAGRTAIDPATRTASGPQRMARPNHSGSQ
jgi:hypothetical protein